MTEAERALREPEAPNRFRRQHSIGRHIVDFACPAARLSVEVDGGQHAIMCEVDHTRSSKIADHGYRVIGFWNGDVMENLARALHIIGEELKVVVALDGPGTPTSPSSSPRVKPAGLQLTPRRVPSLSRASGRRGPICEGARCG